MVGPPSSWSRDQEESLGRLRQQTIRTAGARSSARIPSRLVPAFELLTIFGVYRAGDLVHVFLLVGVMLLLLAVLKARDAALRPPTPPIAN